MQPRHTWSQPIWGLRGKTKIYIAQAARIEEALAKLSVERAKVRTLLPQKTGRLEVITIGGILAPKQVISFDTNQL